MENKVAYFSIVPTGDGMSWMVVMPGGHAAITGMPDQAACAEWIRDYLIDNAESNNRTEAYAKEVRRQKDEELKLYRAAVLAQAERKVS